MNALLLEYLAKAKGITIRELAEKIGVNQATFYRKKKGISDFTREEIKQIKDLLDLDNAQVDKVFFAD